MEREKGMDDVDLDVDIEEGGTEPDNDSSRATADAGPVAAAAAVGGVGSGVGAFSSASGVLAPPTFETASEVSAMEVRWIMTITAYLIICTPPVS